MLALGISRYHPDLGRGAIPARLHQDSGSHPRTSGQTARVSLSRLPGPQVGRHLATEGVFEPVLVAEMCEAHLFI